MKKYHINYKNDVVNMVGATMNRDGIRLVVTEQFYDINTNTTRVTLEEVDDVDGS